MLVALAALRSGAPPPQRQLAALSALLAARQTDPEVALQTLEVGLGLGVRVQGFRGPDLLALPPHQPRWPCGPWSGSA